MSRIKPPVDQKTRDEAKALMESIPTLRGYMRTVYRCDCDGCGRLFLHQYIPFAIGRGNRFNQCLCQITANRMTETTTILEMRDHETTA